MNTYTDLDQNQPGKGIMMIRMIIMIMMIMMTMMTKRKMMMMTIDVSWLKMRGVTAVEVAKASRSPN